MIAILFQSVLFGVGLTVSGTFASTIRRPYRVMESQNATKNSLMSSNLNNTLRIANNMEEEIRLLDDQAAIQERLVDNLNYMMSVSRVFYMDLDQRTGYLYRDVEAALYTSGSQDITCEVGTLKAGIGPAPSCHWKPRFDEPYWGKAEEYWENREATRQWVFAHGSLYYVMAQEADGQRRLMGVQVGDLMMSGYMKLDDPPYKGTNIVLLTEDRVLYSVDPNLTDLPYEMKDGRVNMEIDGKPYSGVRGTLQVYGHIAGGPIYVGTVCQRSELSGLSRNIIQMVALVYTTSMIIAVIFSYIVLNQIMKPLRKLRADIAGQRPDDVFFEPSGLMEIDDIHRALNDMTCKLEQSHNRYSFAMEAAGGLVGSFEYDKMGRRVKLSYTLRRLLDIPEELVAQDNTMLYKDWARVLDKMQPVEDLEDGYWFEDRQHAVRAVTIRRQEEENSVFGMAVDKTDAYKEILRLRNLAQHDQLTGLYNAAYLKVKGQKYLDENSLKANGLVFCDLDNLKYINDTYGHSIGDRYLQAMAEMLNEMARGERCMPIRISGDEFALLYYGYGTRQEIEQLVRDGYDSRPYMELPDGSPYRVNASMGLAYARRGPEDISSLLKRADQAMYYVKRNHKNGVAIYGKPDVPLAFSSKKNYNEE